MHTRAQAHHPIPQMPTTTSHRCLPPHPIPPSPTSARLHPTPPTQHLSRPSPPAPRFLADRPPFTDHISYNHFPFRISFSSSNPPVFHFYPFLFLRSTHHFPSTLPPMFPSRNLPTLHLIRHAHPISGNIQTRMKAQHSPSIRATRRYSTISDHATSGVDHVAQSVWGILSGYVARSGC